MCGIVGHLSVSPDPSSDDATLRRMAQAVAHRGPDDAGLWSDVAHGIGLGHRRLAIVDLSPLGHQPMVSASGRYVLVYNGEIYNHATLRATLGTPPWRGHSDTETLLACFERHGVHESLPLLCGMFAFAVWDRSDAMLTLARDRLGEKPLYFGWQGHGERATFLFGSELKALRAHPAFGAEIDRGALCGLLRNGCIAAPHSIYRGIHKLAPGCSLVVSRRVREPRIRTYWSAVDVARQGANEGRFAGSPEQAVDRLEALLRDAVAQQMMADVPLGAFLSGGIDSSTIVALMQAQSARPVRSFAIGFHEPGYDEAAQARAVARHLGTDHTELYVSADDAMAVIGRLPTLYDEPFADSSQIPTFLVSQLARRHVTVSLSGDAGDELFCGYTRYADAARRWRQLAALPLGMRRWLAARLGGAGPGTASAAPSLRRQRAAEQLACETPDALYRALVSLWPVPARVVLGGHEPSVGADADSKSATLAGLAPMQRMMTLDLLGYLPDDILAKVDRAAMGVGLETRVPFLDHRVVAFARSLPLDCLLRDGQTKWVLRRVLERYLPRRLTERPKMGFAVPIDRWLRGPLRDWAESLIDEAGLHREGYLDAAVIRRTWRQHLQGAPGLQHLLWAVLMFQMWLRDPARRP